MAPSSQDCKHLGASCWHATWSGTVLLFVASSLQRQEPQLLYVQ
jgi:hypothetical protein